MAIFRTFGTKVRSLGGGRIGIASDKGMSDLVFGGSYSDFLFERSVVSPWNALSKEL